MDSDVFLKGLKQLSQTDVQSSSLVILMHLFVDEIMSFRSFLITRLTTEWKKALKYLLNSKYYSGQKTCNQNVL